MPGDAGDSSFKAVVLFDVVGAVKISRADELHHSFTSISAWLDSQLKTLRSTRPGILRGSDLHVVSFQLTSSFHSHMIGS